MRQDASWTGWPTISAEQFAGGTLFSILTFCLTLCLEIQLVAPKDQALVFWLLNFGCSGRLCWDLVLFAVLGWCWLCFAGALSLF